MEQIDRTSWTFPEEISFSSVHEYAMQFQALQNPADVIFDLSATSRLHTSFIGFLISTRHTLAGKGIGFRLRASDELEQILRRMKLGDYFERDTEKEDKKSA